jgi:hypothetical protein
MHPTVANNIPLHGLLFQRRPMHAPIELTPESVARTTGKGSFRMTDETPQSFHAEIRDTATQTHPGEIADESQQQPGGATTYVVQQFPSAESPDPPAKPIIVYATVAIALGLVVGIVFAFVLSRPTGRGLLHDLEPIVSKADGLTGRLNLNWNGKLVYRLVVEPSDPGQQEAFSLAVSSPPRPLSFNIQLKDSAGSVLCNKAVLLKFDPSQAATFASSGTGLRLVTASTGQKSKATYIAASEALELQREQGQDIFQNDLGRDGQSESISVLGQIPCSMQAYERTTSWSLSPDFLTLDEQAAMLKHHADLLAASNPSSPDALADNNASNSRKKAKKYVPVQFKAFAIEGDDELVGYDSSKGIIETNAKTFIIVKASGDGNTAKWGDVPANVHYKCDMNAACTLTRSGAVLLYARLSR